MSREELITAFRKTGSSDAAIPQAPTPPGRSPMQSPSVTGQCEHFITSP
jgi:hypothetical protein